MLYGISTRSTCCCTATVCSCFSQGGTTPITAVISETCPTHISGNQIVWMIIDEPRIVWVVRPYKPPPRYERRSRPHFRFSTLRLDRKTEVNRAGRERGHAFGHSPRN